MSGWGRPQLKGSGILGLHLSGDQRALNLFALVVKNVVM